MIKIKLFFFKDYVVFSISELQYGKLVIDSFRTRIYSLMDLIKHFVGNLGYYVHQFLNL